MRILDINSWSSILDKTIIIGGSARSGTTIMGQLLNSLEKVEYYFEPPMLVSLLLKGDELTNNSLKELLKFYFVDSFLMDCLAGRNINLNTNDDSCILNVKTIEDIQTRQNKSYGRVELENIVKHSRFSFKLPEIVFFFKSMNSLFPNNKKILMHRNSNDVINSIVRKKWFSDEFLDKNHSSQIFAIKIIDNKKIPYWVKSKDEDFWINASEIDRCGYYYKRISEEIYTNSTNSIIIDYDEFIQKPYKVFTKVTKYLQLNITEKTNDILDTVKYQHKERKDYLEELSKSMYKEVVELDKKLKNISLKE